MPDEKDSSACTGLLIAWDTIGRRGDVVDTIVILLVRTVPDCRVKTTP